MEKINEKNIVTIVKKIKESKNITIISHENPDGDTIGSATALYGVLKNLGLNAKLIINDKLPVFLQWLPYSKNYVIYENNISEVKKIINNTDLFFHIDYNAFERTGNLFKLLKQKQDTFSILIDHHPNPSPIAKFSYSYTDKSSTAEVLFNFLKIAKLDNYINHNEATCLYAGIITDTGNFVFNSSSPQLFITVAELLKKGINKDEIYSNIYYNFSYNRMKLLGFALSERMFYWQHLNTAFITLYDKDLKRFNHQKGDTENIVNMLFYIKNVKFALLMIEKKDHIKISMRSRGQFPANYIASKYFNGGGHLNAAGAKCLASMNETIQKLKNVLENDENVKQYI